MCFSQHTLYPAAEKRRGGGEGETERESTESLTERRGCVSPTVPVDRGMQASDGWCKTFAVWAMWMLYVCFAMALTLGRSDGPSGQGFSSLRVESLLSKMTLEDKVGCAAVVRCLNSAEHPVSLNVDYCCRCHARACHDRCS